MPYDQESLNDLWPARLPTPEVTEHENGIHIFAPPPPNATTPWEIRINTDNGSNVLVLDAIYEHEDGLSRIKLASFPDSDSNGLQNAINMTIMLWHPLVNELY